MVVLYFYVRIRAGGDASASGALVASRSNSQKFPYHFLLAEGGAGEVAKKLKENFGVAKSIIVKIHLS